MLLPISFRVCFPKQVMSLARVWSQHVRRGVPRAIALALIVLVASRAAAVEIQLGQHKFTLPDGLTIQRIAGPPLVDRPITADFDEQGRLYVADSSGSNDPVKVQLEERPHRIVRLADSDGDGIFDTRTIFADRMMFPEGTLWHDGSLYVSAPPSIWKLTDTDDDGVADQRVEWYQGKTLTGCANDLHGPYLGPDGWIYWCKGAFAEQNLVINGAPWTTRASHIFRCRPDGSGLEPVMTGGMDNPVDVAFLPEGERVFTTTFLIHPSSGQRDGLLHAVYGGVYGKDHGVLEGHPRTGELMPVLTHLGAAAPCGLTLSRSDGLGEAYRHNLFACQFNLRKVSRHELARDGASYTTRDSDLVVSDQLDFHPTDVLEDADGSVIVVDTGGWYKLCCPTSQLHKPDVLGAIYRVRRADAPAGVDPRGLKLDWQSLSANELAALLADPRHAVRQRAAGLLAPQGETAVAALRALCDQSSAATRCEIIWTLTRVEAESARSAVRSALTDADPIVRQAALHSVSLWRDRAAQPSLLKILQDDSPHHRRVAAEALGRIGDPAVVPALLRASADASDRFLEHAITFALIEIAAPAATAAGLEADHPRMRRAALIALDQMSGGKVQAQQVQPLLTSEEPLLQETARWLVRRHSEWGGELATYLESRLSEINDANADGAPEFQSLLLQLMGHSAVQDLLARAAMQQDLPVPGRQIALRAMAESKPKVLPVKWADALANVIRHGDRTLVAAAVAAARELPTPEKDHAALREALGQVAKDTGRDAQVRLDAMAAVPGGLNSPDAADYEFLLQHLDTDHPLAARSAAADAIARAQLSDEQLKDLALNVGRTGPLELHRVLAAFERSSNESIGLTLLDVLKNSPVLTSLRIDELKQRLVKYGPAVTDEIDQLYALVNIDVDTQRERIERMLPLATHGDVRRGQAVFNSSKAACTACHRFGYQGGDVGPDMTRIGQTRNERDLLEAILYPSLSFVRSYEPVTIVTVDGRIVNGLIRNETADEIVVATGVNQQQRIARDEIEEQRPGTVSIMPSGLDEQLTEQELADLVAFLKNAR